MRVLQCLAPHDVGGIESMVRSLATGLNARGIDVQVAAMVPAGGPGERWVKQVEALGVPVTVIPPTRALHRDIAALRSTLATFRADVLHAHGYRSDILAALLVGPTRPRTVATVHGFSPTNWRSQWYARLDRLSLRRFDRVLAVSGVIRDQLVAGGVSRARVQVLHNGIDVAPAPEPRESLRTALGLNPGDLVIGSVGRLSAEKGHGDLLQAVARVRRREVRLLLVGDGPEREALQRMVGELDLADQVRFLGVRHDVERLYPAFDVFALPSHTEGSPTALLEAFAYGVPVLATRVGAVPDMLRDGQEGVLVPPQAPAGLADGLGKLFASGGLRQSLAERAKRRYEAEFRRDHWLDSITSAYRELVGRSRGAARQSDSPTGAHRREDNGDDHPGRVMDHLAGRQPADPAEPSA